MNSAAALPAKPTLSSRWSGLSAGQIALVALALVLAMQIELVFSKSVNWDEFFHFSEINQFLLGRWTPWLQTPFVYLYFWVPSLPGDDYSHIHIIRALILPFELATAGFIFLMARQFASREAALISTLAYVTGGYVFLHAFALRADMIAAALLSAMLWIVLCRPLRARELAITGLLMALAFVATIKSVLYAPAFVGACLFRLENPAQRRLLLGITLAMALAGTILLLSAPILPATGPLGIFGQVANLSRGSIHRMFFGGLFPQGRYLLKEILLAPVLAALICIAIACAWKAKDKGQTWLALFGLLAPLLSVAIYRNAFPYYYAFILPPAAVATGPAAELILRRYGFLPLSLVLLANAACLSLAENRSVTEHQKIVQLGLHEIFPKPVTYIDESGMIGSYPRAVNHFATAWALENYLHEGRPAYSEAIGAETVPFIILNSFTLQNVFTETGLEGHLLPSDVRTIRENYIPHWGLVYVAGKQIDPGSAPLIISVAVPGTYTVEGASIQIDGTQYATGSLVTLLRGTHRIGGMRHEQTTLRWGDHLHRPAYDWPQGSIFSDY